MDTRGFSPEDRDALVDAWLLNADFLTQPFPDRFRHVIGNPPYLRIEALPSPLLLRYPTHLRAMYDRAGIHIAFFEKGLSPLRPEGRLGYIRAIRSTKNHYGGPLRGMIAEPFQIALDADFTGVDALSGEVAAYPAVAIIRNGCRGQTRVIDKEDIPCGRLAELAKRMLDVEEERKPPLLTRIDRVHPHLAATPKLLIPGIQGEPQSLCASSANAWCRNASTLRPPCRLRTYLYLPGPKTCCAPKRIFPGLY